MKYTISEMSLGEILDQSIKLMKNNFLFVLKIASFLYIPTVLIQMIIILILIPDLSGEVTEEAMQEFYRVQNIVLGINAIIGLLLIFVVTPITNGAIISGIAKKYLEDETSAGESLAHAVRRLAALLGTSIMKGILVFLGFVLLIIPGIYLMFRWWFSSHVVMIENMSGSEALKKSAAIIKGNMGKAFMLGLLLGIIGWLAQLIPGLIPGRWAAMLVQVGLQAVLYVFGIVAGVVFYFSSKCKNENFDLKLLALSMGVEQQSEDTELPEQTE
jgi:hypothetical protein